MKVGFVGNMNNNHFAMVRYLRDVGVDAELLLLDNEHVHFQPRCDTYDLDFDDYCRDLQWGNRRDFLRVAPERVRSDLEPYDLIVATGLAPAFCHRAGRRVDIMKMYGFDLFGETKYQIWAPHVFRTHMMATYHQRRGIATADIFHMGTTNPIFESFAGKYAGNVKRWDVPLPMVHAPTYAPELIARNLTRTHWGWRFKEIREEAEFMVFAHSRHCWTCPESTPDYKGTDRLLRGWADFVDRNPGMDVRLVTLGYGPDVAASKELIAELGIADTVVWMPAMYRKDLMVGLALSDLCAWNFGHSWLASGVAFEALVAGVPLLCYRDDDFFADHDINLYEIFNAREAPEISDGFERCVRNLDESKAIGERGRNWYESTIVTPVRNQYVDYIASKS